MNEAMEVRDMGEKGNLVDVSEKVFANLAEQGPQFWIAHEQYKLARDNVEQTRTPSSRPQARAHDPSDRGADRLARG